MIGIVRDWLAFGLGVVLLQALLVSSARADELPPCPEDIRCLVVADPYIDMHSGPGRGFPIVFVAGRGEMIEVLKRRTDWFLVRTSRQVEGWVSREQILNTLEITGELVDLKEPSRNDYTSHRWQGSLFFGRFEGASLLGASTSYALSDHLSAELTLAVAPGNLTTSYVGTIGLNHTVAPEWVVSPYVGMGTGIIIVDPRVTLVQPIDRTDQIGYVAGGARGFIGRRFMWRAEYRGNVVFTSRNENEEIHEWKVGFAFFF